MTIGQITGYFQLIDMTEIKPIYKENKNGDIFCFKYRRTCDQITSYYGVRIDSNQLMHRCNVSSDLVKEMQDVV